MRERMAEMSYALAVVMACTPYTGGGAGAAVAPLAPQALDAGNNDVRWLPLTCEGMADERARTPR